MRNDGDGVRFVGSSIFSAAFALLGVQELIGKGLLGFDASHFHDPRQSHFILEAARVDRDHRAFHADLHSAAAALGIDPLSSASSRAQPADASLARGRVAGSISKASRRST